MSSEVRRSTSRSRTLVRLLKTMLSFYPVMLPVAVICIVLNALISSLPSVFMQNVIAIVEDSFEAGDWAPVSGQIMSLVCLLAVFYVLSLAAGFAFNQLMAIIPQGSLMKLRERMFGGMQRLPIKYFDVNNHGDIMSYYTNDIDTLRQMISQSFPQLLVSAVTVITVFCIMIYYCVWLTLVVVLGIALMTLIIRRIGGKSSSYFISQHERSEGYKGLLPRA